MSALLQETPERIGEILPVGKLALVALPSNRYFSLNGLFLLYLMVVMAIFSYACVDCRA